MIQTKILTVTSNFSYAFDIVSVKSPDPRIDIRLLDKVIKPHNTVSYTHLRAHET